MTHAYNITGLTCNGCVAKAKSELLKLYDITEAEVQLQSPQATLTMRKHIPLHVLQAALSKHGNYQIAEVGGEMHDPATNEKTNTFFKTYKPVLFIFGYLSLISLIAASGAGNFNPMTGMRVFMGGFFLTFSFFKMLDLNGFAESYSTYDIIARQTRSWGFIYAFVELFLGLAYIINFQPVITNAVTFIVMTVSIIGVLQSVLHKRKIQCACLGTVFNLPMSTVTIIEDTLMIAMSAGTFLHFLSNS